MTRTRRPRAASDLVRSSLEWFTYDELAARLGCTTSSLGNWLQGKPASDEFYAKLRALERWLEALAAFARAASRRRRRGAER